MIYNTFFYLHIIESRTAQAAVSFQRICQGSVCYSGTALTAKMKDNDFYVIAKNKFNRVLTFFGLSLQRSGIAVSKYRNICKQ